MSCPVRQSPVGTQSVPDTFENPAMSIPLPRFSLIRFVFLLVPLFFVPAVEAQEKSVNPGINCAL